ncbi:MAG: DUF255 domain-containing protein [Bacteriovoracaceae bacterium]|nr:DUF255 domain-containing protein [Bacteriovoracaceae bacterium]
MKNSAKNLLSLEKSLYLKQHEEQSIHWKSWNEETWKLIEESKKCVFISIGYSSCHWCHVMAHESFESEEVSEYLNEHFISIKIDREEFPDVDFYYQRAANYMGKNGGWPLSVYLSPEMVPLFIGTYFPLESRPNLPSFLNVSKEVIKRYSENETKDTMLSQGHKLIESLKERHKITEAPKYEGHFPSANQILLALENYRDKNFGGFGKAPKFPQFAFYEAMIEQILEGVVDKERGEPIIQTIEWMLMGGIFDHAKGGIHRYSTDEKWLVPHFEKMLYDQAGLLKVLSKLSLIFPSPLVLDGIMQTIDYLQTEMLSENKYFFSAQDADSEGREGLYFTFSKEEFEDALNQFDETLMDNESEKIHKWFSITDEGNFEDRLHVISLNAIHKEEFYQPANWEIVRKVRRAILNNRKLRIPPATDQKGIAGWNFMLVSALVDVVQYVRIDPIKEKAQQLLKSVIVGLNQTFVNHKGAKDGASELRILHSTTFSQGNQNKIYFEDYAFFADAYFRLYQVSGEKTYLDYVLRAMKIIDEKFISHDDIYQREVGVKNSVIDNPLTSYHDQSYASSLCVWISLNNKLSLLGFPSESSRNLASNLMRKVREHALQNPLAFGEGLKFLIYPPNAFKRVEIPFNWTKENKFLELIPHFSSRFVLDYKDSFDVTQEWQICRSDACEVNGKGLEEFISTLFKKD